MAGFKTAVPALGGAIDRPAARAALHRATAAARWLTGPSGSGKSTLVAQHVGRHPMPTVWYRLDARDDDAAFFYASFALAIRRAFDGGPPLPSFSDDDRGRETAFAERFFTSVHRRAGIGAFVLDNAHELTSGVMQDALGHFAALSANAGEIWFISEGPPPLPFFDTIAARQVALCNDVPLAFDAGECAALASASRVRAMQGGELATLTGGHAATLVLACELLRDVEGDESARAEQTVAQIHRHLLGRVLDRMPDARRDVLLRTCFATQFNAAIAARVAGDAAPRELDALHARGLLRRTGSAGAAVYEAHGLVRRGLANVLADRIGNAAVEALAARTADALQAEGFDEDAFELLVARGDFEGAADVLERIVERYARRGNAELAARTLGCLPASVIDARPWLCFWAGQALLGWHEEAARIAFERAYAAFERVGDAAGMRLAAARVITAFGMEYGDLRTLDAWMERHARAEGNAPVTPGIAYESALLLGLFNVTLMRGAHPYGIDPDAIVDRLHKLLDDVDAWMTPHEPVAAARVLVDHACIFHGTERAKAFIAETRSYAERIDVSALQRGRWYIAAASVHFNAGDHERAKPFLAAARTLAEESASLRLAFEAGMASVNAALKRSELTMATAELALLEAIAVTAPPAQRAEYARINARTLLMQDRLDEGLRWAEQARATAELAGYSGAHKRLYEIEYVYALVANGRYDDAITVADEAVAEQDERQRDVMLAIRDAVRFLASGLRDITLLDATLARAARMNFVNLLSRVRGGIACLCQVALARGMHVEFVRRVIEAQHLAPPANAGDEWPWPVRVRTLGGFELDMAGAPYRPSHKTQDKPLELLKLLLTCRALGRASADRDWIAERLWPDAEVSNPRKSLEMTLSRLRRLLGDDSAVLLSEGRVQLSPMRVWSDVDPLLQALRHAGVHKDGKARGMANVATAAVADITAVLDHYHGRFLPEDGDAPWLIAGREAIAGAVRSALLIADAVLDGRADDSLIPALERALLADPTSEDLGRALMRAWQRRGEHAEAIRVYRRLREMLSVILGLPPSRETEKLRVDVYASVAAADTLEGAAAIAPDRAGR